MSTTPDVFVVLRATISEFSARMAEARGEMAKTEEKGSSAFHGLAAVGQAAFLGIATAAVGVGIESIKMATQFQASMTLLNTQAGVPQAAIAELSKGVLSLAGTVATSPDSLAQALFHVESSFASTGISGQKALDILKVAAEGAKIGHANLIDVTNALDGAIASGIPGVQNYAQAMGALNAIVGAGDMTMQNLSDALGGGVLAVVKNYGVTLADAGAALATFGDNNMRGAEAGTALRMSVQALAVPTAAGRNVLKSFGMTATELATDMQQGGLVKALQDLKTHMTAAGDTGEKTGAVLTEIFGKRAGTGVAVLFDQLDRLKSKYADIGTGASQFGSDWKTTTETLSFQFGQLKATAETWAVELGTRLIPMVESVMKAVVIATSWLEKHRDVAIALSVVIGGVLLAAMGAWIVSLFMAGGALAFLLSPVALVVLGIAAMAVVIVELWMHWNQVWQWIMDHKAYAAIIAIFFPIIAGIVAVVGIAKWLYTNWDQVWTSVSKAAETAWKMISGVIDRAWAIIKPIWNFMFAAIKDVLVLGFQILRAEVEIVWAAIGPIISAAWNEVIKPVFDAIVSVIKNDVAPVFDWLWHNIIQPAWDGISSATSAVWSGIGHVISAGVNDAIDVINFFVGAIDDVISVIPGVQKISKLQHIGGGGLASSNVGLAGYTALTGVTPGRAAGGITDGPAVLVGEGNPSHPEYIIPTDPAHRGNALGLFAGLARQLGIPGMDGGGVLGTITGAIGGAVSGALNLAGGALDAIRSGTVDLLLKPVMDTVASMLGSVHLPFAAGMVKLVESDLVSFIKGQSGTVVSASAPTGTVPGNAIDWILTAMGLTGTPDSWLVPLENIARFESGFDPHAINLTDSNAAAGHPSKGMFQTIDSTFKAYALAGHGDIWNPVDNAAAAIGYIRSRYRDPFNTPGERSLAAGGPYVGYDSGGMLMPGLTMAYNGTGRPEQVIGPDGAGGQTIVQGDIYLDGQKVGKILAPIIRAEQLRRNRSLTTSGLG